MLLLLISFQQYTRFLQEQLFEHFPYFFFFFLVKSLSITSFEGRFVKKDIPIKVIRTTASPG